MRGNIKNEFGKFARLKVAECLEREALTAVARRRSNLCDAKYERHDECERERNIGDEGN